MHEEIAAALGVSIADVQTMDARLSGSDTSLQAPVGGSDSDGGERLDFLASDAPLPDEQVSEMIDGERARVWLRDALGALTEREMRIIRARRLTEEGATLEELGIDLGISKERVRQIETRALEKLRAALATRAPALTAGIH